MCRKSQDRRIKKRCCYKHLATIHGCVCEFGGLSRIGRVNIWRISKFRLGVNSNIENSNYFVNFVGKLKSIFHIFIISNFILFVTIFITNDPELSFDTASIDALSTTYNRELVTYKNKTNKMSPLCILSEAKTNAKHVLHMEAQVYLKPRQDINW